MKNYVNVSIIGVIIYLFISVPFCSFGQKNKKISDELFAKIAIKPVKNIQQKYRMTAIYTNRDLYGKFIDKTKISGDYIRGLENDKVKWQDVYVSVSNKIDASFEVKTKQNYIENFTYVPSPKMLDAKSFQSFPTSTESVYARNLVWDMMAIEGFAWDHLDSLKLNKIYRISELNGEFDMADVGTYDHADIQLCWSGITLLDDDYHAVIEYTAIDNIVEISMETVKTKGTEQYWGTVWISLKKGEIGHALMYSGSIQEIEVSGMANKFIIKTIRELWVEKVH